ncbi:hypothetical protein Tco_1209049, partial [Tanacetum coccineum]
MSNRVDRHLVHGIWGNNSFEFESKISIGKSGGILAVWDSSMFLMQSKNDGEGFGCIRFVACNQHALSHCDFNEVRSNVERKGLIFCQKGADLFNDFIASSDLRQKAKTRWALEGDENSGFFYGIININRNRSRINGLNIHGSWTTDPTALKSHIFQVYNSKFKEDVISRPTFSCDNFNKLFSGDLLILDYPISDQEIKDAVWDCGSEKAPDPDGFTFKFYKSQWDTITPDVIAYIREFENTSFLLRGCNSYFIALVPKVKDPLVINNFRPISLISSQYTILAKILANRLAMVIPSVVSEAQT